MGIPPLRRIRFKVGVMNLRTSVSLSNRNPAEKQSFRHSCHVSPHPVIVRRGRLALSTQGHVAGSLCLGLVLAVLVSGPAGATEPVDKGEQPAGPGTREGESHAWEKDAVREAGQKFRDCADCPQMVVAPDRSYAVGVYEVTRGEWAAFVRATGYSAGNSCWTYENDEGRNRRGRSWRHPGFSQTARHPVVCVNWHDAQEYVRWLSEKTGQEYRLLTKAEWEDVARGTEGGSQCRYANGADLAAGTTYPDLTTAECDDGYVWTAPVGSYASNEQGVYDIVGNVWEWVADCWKGDCSLRMLRGGSWLNAPRHLRSAYRFRGDAGFRKFDDGFRIARTLTP